MKMINEGGNIFKTKEGQPLTQRIDRAEVLPTVQWLEKILGIPLVDNMLGTTGKNPTSGDLDLAVDEKKTTKDDLVSKLTAWCVNNDLDPRDYIRKSGISVHFKTPIDGDNTRFVQTDLMLGDPAWMNFSMQGGAHDSPYKGMHRHILMASIAKARGMKWSFSQGLTTRDTGAILSRNPDHIAEYLLGTGAKGSDLASVETIIAKIKNNPDYDTLVADARETLTKDGVMLPESYAPGTAAWFRNMYNLFGQ